MAQTVQKTVAGKTAKAAAGTNKERSASGASGNATNARLDHSGSHRFAVVLVRGLVDVSYGIKDTLAMLRLTRKNHCVVVADTPITRGMLQKVKDYATWGEISEEMFKQLVLKRGMPYEGRLTDSGKKYSYKVLDVAGKAYKPYFRLNPPQKGFGRKGIKTPFNRGGALGYRSDKMNDLILRML